MKKNKFLFLTINFSLFLVMIGFLLVPHFTQAQLVTSITNPLLIRQQKIAELWQLLGEIIKELNIIIAEQKTLVINKASSGTSTTTATSSSTSMSPASKSVVPASNSLSPASSSVSQGVENSFNKPFGGITGEPIPCTCTEDYFLIPLTPPNPGLPKFVMYSISKATTYLYRQIPKKGVYLLGTYGDQIICKVRVGNGCIKAGEGPDVKMVGTSY